MCGINGIFAYGGGTIDHGELLVSRECMRSRGPDAADVWISEDRRVGLGHRRLSIIDLSEAGAQPMRRGALVIIFNGEIYNYKELRARLEARGRTFTSHSDTEVLLALYDEVAEQMFNELRGMFAIALWDGARKRMLLARDPYGIKPLYYADDGATLRVASQVKALIAGGRVSKQFDPAAAAGFFLRGTVPEPFTMYRAIRALPAGSYCYVDASGVHEPVQYFSIAATLLDAVRHAREVSDDERLATVHDAVLESVHDHMEADVEVGAFLSAGIDSTAIIALAQEDGRVLRTMTLGFDEYRGRDNDETLLAAEVAKRYGMQHSIRILTYEEFVLERPRIFAAMDQPTVDGLNSYFISKAARELGLKVALSGAGGDELFGGYNSFRDIPRWIPYTSALARIPFAGDAIYFLNTALSKLTRHVSPKMGELVRHGSTYEGAYYVKRGRFLESELPEFLGKDIATEGLRRLQILNVIKSTITPDPGNPFARVAALESSLYLRNQLLRDMDWASMAHSLEVRVPLVDAHLLRKLAPVLVTRRAPGKQILADAPRPPLPPEVRNRRKTGFTLPMREWMKREGRTDFNKRTWAKDVYAAMFSPENGYW